MLLQLDKDVMIKSDLEKVIPQVGCKTSGLVQQFEGISDGFLTVVNFISNNLDAFIFIILEDLPELEKGKPLDFIRRPAKEIYPILVSPQSLINNECINIAPGEGKQPKSNNDKI